MESRKLSKEDIDKVRDIEGFPNGTDEDIISLSNAPYYTACPNPFIEEFIRVNGTPYDEASDNYHREPFAADVSEGKKDPIYNAHNYHTKVPYKAIMRYILQYTNPGDIVFDGFCGTGMTGVAAQMCGSNDHTLETMLCSENKKAMWGKRKAVLSDLSPVASFISANYNNTVSSHDFSKAALQLLKDFIDEYGWMYETEVDNSQSPVSVLSELKARINYTVWSDVFICPNCSTEFAFSDVAASEDGTVKKEFQCPCCKAKLTKRTAMRAKDMRIDSLLNETVEFAKQVPVLINYSFMGKSYNKKPSKKDIMLIEKINTMSIPYPVPVVKFPDGDKTSEPKRLGMNYVHQIYQKRNLIALAYLFHRITNITVDSLRSKIRFAYEQLLWGMSKLSRYVPTHYSQVNQYLNGTLFIGSQVVETSPMYILENKIKNLSKVFATTSHFSNKDVIVSTTSLTNTTCPDSCIDYIFTDPPFGDNLMYSELNLIIEAWGNVLTHNETEAIMNTSQKKALLDYQELMTKCFCEYYRVLKPNRWMTVEFHNSKNAIWNAIQEALNRAGFVIADIRTIDKQQGSFNQVKGASQAIKQDLVISAYKPKESFKREFIARIGSEETAWSFVRQHLENVPVVVVSSGKIEIVSERQAYLLFDRMVAYHIINGIPVPLDATDFYRGLDGKYLKRDGMYFLADQVNEYDAVRIQHDVEPIQFSLFVTNEKTARAWLYQQLNEPQNYAEIQPKFMQEVKSVDKFEAMPELAVLLEENFLQDEKGRWYIPDTTKEGDVTKLREKKLWKEFEGYMNNKGKLKLFRSEAIRVGFSKLWKDKNYQAIVDLAERLPEQTIQEDPNLLMYYDISLSRV